MTPAARTLRPMSMTQGLVWGAAVVAMVALGAYPALAKPFLACT